MLKLKPYQIEAMRLIREMKLQTPAMFIVLPAPPTK